MIARIWQGAVPAGKADAYFEYLEHTGLRDYRSTAGNRGVWVLRRVEGDVAHFLLLAIWESMDAIRRFAGPEPSRARYYPEDDVFLVEKEPTVAHYQVLASTQQ